MTQEFGGDWTDKKLRRLKDYLSAYTRIFKKNRKASFFRITYFDAFAGSGYRQAKTSNRPPPPSNGLFGPVSTKPRPPSKGSAAIALEISPSFDQYIFVDNKQSNISSLKHLRQKHPEKKSSILIKKADANKYLSKWCKTTDWTRNRAVVFIDPYGMQVKWSTLKAIAQTEAIDLWLLFPLGQGVNRLLTKGSLPGGLWSKRLTAVLGTEKWRDAFYVQRDLNGLFGPTSFTQKSATFESIEKFFVARLETIFCEVARNPLPLMNSKNVPIFLLCFAASNRKGASIAVKIASSLLRN